MKHVTRREKLFTRRFVANCPPTVLTRWPIASVQSDFATVYIRVSILHSWVETHYKLVASLQCNQTSLYIDGGLVRISCMYNNKLTSKALRESWKSCCKIVSIILSAQTACKFKLLWSDDDNDVRCQCGRYSRLFIAVFAFCWLRGLVTVTEWILVLVPAGRKRFWSDER